LDPNDPSHFRGRRQMCNTWKLVLENNRKSPEVPRVGGGGWSVPQPPSNSILKPRPATSGRRRRGAPMPEVGGCCGLCRLPFSVVSGPCVVCRESCTVVYSREACHMWFAHMVS
jgi:hypothetical protein